MKKCYIFGASEVFGNPSPTPCDFVIAADGGYDYLNDRGILPDVIVGDFDSVSAFPKNNDVEIFRYPVKKDETDMYLAYRIGVEKGYTDFYIYGGTEGREDHTFANYSLLLRAKNDGNIAVLFGRKMKIYIAKNEQIEIEGGKERTVSVFALGGVASGVTIKGMKYEAQELSLSPDFPLGVSNSTLCGKGATVSVGSGTLLIMEEL